MHESVIHVFGFGAWSVGRCLGSYAPETLGSTGHMAVHYSSKSSEWETPLDFFGRLDAEFHFTLDPCATAENAKCEKFFTKEDDGLSKSWAGEVVFMNPPYGRQIKKWIAKAYSESEATVVCLIPSRTDTQYWHNYVMRAHEIRFIKGRLKFSGHKDGAPFPSAVVVFKPGSAPETRIRSMEC